MKRPGFAEGAGVALVLSGAGAALYAVLALGAAGGALRLVVALAGLAYVWYLLARSRSRVGRLTTLAAWAVLAAACWWFIDSPALYLLAHVGVLWLVRSLYFHSNTLAAIADLGLNVLAAAAAVWAASRTGSVFAALWCFFLVQAAFVLIPARLGRRQPGNAAIPDDRFGRALRNAETAVRRLTTIR